VCVCVCVCMAALSWIDILFVASIVSNWTGVCGDILLMKISILFLLHTQPKYHFTSVVVFPEFLLTDGYRRICEKNCSFGFDYGCLQGVARKYSPKKFGNISPMKENFKIKFYMPMLCFYLQNCQILSNYVWLWQSYAILSTIILWIFTFHLKNTKNVISLQQFDQFPQNLTW